MPYWTNYVSYRRGHGAHKPSAWHSKWASWSPAFRLCLQTFSPVIRAIAQEDSAATQVPSDETYHRPFYYKQWNTPNVSFSNDEFPYIGSAKLSITFSALRGSRLLGVEDETRLFRSSDWSVPPSSNFYVRGFIVT